MRGWQVLLALAYVLLLAGCSQATPEMAGPEAPGGDPLEPGISPVEAIPENERSPHDWIVVGAREEVRRRTRYDSAYVVLAYPGGDVELGRGACTDVVVRALRQAGYDLQVLIHEDMRDNWDLYPKNWGLASPDPSIDHRRVPNQIVFFQRHGQALTTSTRPEDLFHWRWGDIVYWRFPSGQDHCGVVSDRVGPSGLPLVIHNAGIAMEEDCLTRWEITGHFRYPPESPREE
ncbi:MAG: DUF1287 domain-containing protein [Bacillota bacterium]